ncbi:MAG TPA: M48 family metalloprotease [Burkholderiales bacterium]|nr:M48 family metalloprotease [Burkholderiales bacterium]
MQMQLKALLLVALLAVVPLALADDLPDLGDPASLNLSPEMGYQIGLKLAREIRSSPSYLDDAEVIDYLDTVGNGLVAAMPSPYAEFQFLPIRDPEINSFAMPGGFVGVNTGLIMATDNESELAAVLAHEITHVTQNHLARMLTQQQQLEMPTMLALAAAIIAGRSDPDLGMGVVAMSQAGAMQNQLHFSQNVEREADRIGLQRMAKAGYDVREMGDFFEKLQRKTSLMEDGSVPSWLRDHPLTPERIADAENRAAEYPYRPHVDSIEYGLVRAKLRATSGDAPDAVQYFDDRVREHRYASESAARYGLAVALLRAGRAAEAKAQLARLRALAADSPMIETLAARVQQALGDAGGALAILGAARQRFPNRLPLDYAYVAALQDAGRNKDALAALSEPLRLHPHDEQLHMLLAKTYAALGKRLLQHQAQAEVYVLQGSLPQAIEQLQLAQNAGDGDFYQLSTVDARLRELRAQQRQQASDAKRN